MQSIHPGFSTESVVFAAYQQLKAYYVNLDGLSPLAIIPCTEGPPNGCHQPNT